MNLKGVTSEGLKQIGILVADDDEGMRGMLFLLFTRLGYRVVLAENGRKALDLFSEGSVSLVVTDLCMPEMDGLTLAARVKVASPKTPIIMITGSQIQEGVETNRVDYIVSKPFQLDDIHRTVEMALDGAIFRPRTDQGAEIHLQG
jgi:DNA-binding NtrC family response regulator